MQVTLNIPDTLAAELTAAGQNTARFALEAILVEAYRRRQTSEGEMKRILGYGTRMQVHDLLTKFGVCQQYNSYDLAVDMGTVDQFDGDRDEIHLRYEPESRKISKG